LNTQGYINKILTNCWISEASSISSDLSPSLTDTATKGVEPLLIVQLEKSGTLHISPSLHLLVIKGPNGNDEWISEQRIMAVVDTGVFGHNTTSNASSQAIKKRIRKIL